MADFPKLFKSSMVRAILREIEKPGTGKTQTRRVLNPQPTSHVWRYGWTREDGATWSDDKGSGKLRIWAGDRLWVRETWRTGSALDKLPPRDLEPGTKIDFLADNDDVLLGKLRPSMFMPKWASRITLEVVDVKVERLQDISREDALAEGLIVIPHAPPRAVEMGCNFGFEGDSRHGSPISAYASLWESINGPGSWEANPWVAAYSFKPILGNIDQIGGGNG